MNENPRVYIVDDDEPIRDAISMLLDSVNITHECYESATRFLDARGEESRGALILDIRMPGMSGLELQQALIDRGSSLPIIFITGHGDIPMAVEAMRKGAVDFIRKPFRDQELLDRIHEALSLDRAQDQVAAAEAGLRNRIAELTPREQEVFERVAAGQANKVIAIELGISERTVEIHRSQVMRKTASRSLADLVRLKLSLEQLDGTQGASS